MRKEEKSLLDQFLEALHSKKKVQVKFYSKEDDTTIIRVCAPMDFAPNRRAKDKTNRLHFWDFTSDVGGHTLSLLLSQVRSIEILGDSFDPSEFMKWEPNWLEPRDWGSYS